MASIPLGGLASGVDTEFLIQQLMLLERQPKNKLELRKKVAEHRKTQLNDINVRLKALKTAAADLRSSGIWADTQTVESNDTTRLGVRRTGGAAAGVYQVEITSLARAEQRTFDYLASGSASTITVNGHSFNVAANATLQDVVNTINGDAASPVYAAAVSGQLVLSSKTIGTPGAFTASGSTVTEDGAKEKVATDAVFRVDGGAPRTSTTNVVADAIAGVEFTLKNTTAAGTTVAVTVGAPALDKAKVTDKVKAFVEKYNDVISFVSDKVKERRVPNATTEVDARKGVLYNDPMLNSLVSRLRVSVTDAQAGNPAALDELAEIGISTGGTTGSSTFSADAVTGKLVLDEAKLTAALDSDPTAVKKLLGGFTGVEGYAQRLEAIIDPMTTVDGDVEQRMDAASAESQRLADQITEMERRIGQREARLRAQFTAMERMLQQSQAQGSWLSGQLARL